MHDVTNTFYLYKYYSWIHATNIQCNYRCTLNGIFMFLTAYCWNSCIIVKKLAIAGVAIMILDCGEAFDSVLKSLRYISFAFWSKSIVNCFVSDKSFWSVNNMFLDALIILLSTRSFETLSFLSVFIGGCSMVGWSSLFSHNWEENI